MKATPPVLFVIFNRPDFAFRVFERIREAEPPALFVAADGPRADVAGETALCEEARGVVEKVDWDCDVHTLFRKENLGCKEGVSSAITWFFEHVEEGVILADDCLPHPSFFPYCAELLARYRHDTRIFAIGGNNFNSPGQPYEASYYFSLYCHVWGWATWRSAWQCYDGRLQDWPSLRSTDWLEEWVGDPYAARPWANIFDRVHAGQIDSSWSYPWMYSIWTQSGLSIVPAVNLVTNIGFGDERGTHSQNPDSPIATMDVESVSRPMVHPEKCIRHYALDHYTTRTHYGVSYPSDLAMRSGSRVQENVDRWARRGRHLKSDPLGTIYRGLKRAWG